MAVDSNHSLIITPYALNNYGNRLQNYATATILKQFGINAYTYTPNLGLKSIFRAAIRKRLLLLNRDDMRTKRMLAFSEFDSRIKKLKADELKHEDYLIQKRLVVVGSDQIWNPHQVNLGGKEYGLSIPNAYAISLSASFGITSIPQQYTEYVAKGLKNMRQISVRENSGKEIVRVIANRDAIVTIDPTMAFDINEWNLVSSNSLIPSEPYGFSYLLDNSNDDTFLEIDNYFKMKGLLHVPLLVREYTKIKHDSQKEYYNAGPQDFISLIREASLVCTDSFHAFVFSLLYKKPVCLLLRKDNSYSMFSRFDTISELLEVDLPITSHVCSETAFLTNFTNVDNRLDIQRERLKKYLNVALEPFIQ